MDLPKFDRDSVPSEEKLAARVRNKPEVQEYIKQFRPETVDSFFNHYSKMMHHALESGPLVEHYEKERPLEFLNKAEEYLWEIQQKKLFNLQCRWRAELVKVPGLESTHDFNYWAHYIQSCPFVEPVTQQEVDMYKEFLLSGRRTDDSAYVNAYQEYEDYKEETDPAEKELIIPEWYHYYDEKMGTGDLINLPDIRGQKEEAYLEKARGFWQKEAEERRKQKEAEGPPTPPRMPYISGGEKEILEFAGLFDTEEVIGYLKWEYEDRRESYDYEDVWAALHFLENVKEYLSFVPHPDWREAVKLTVHKYKCARVAEALQDVYNTYRMRMETGIGYPHNPKMRPRPDGTFIEDYQYIIFSKKRVLEARKIAGEPENWDF